MATDITPARTVFDALLGVTTTPKVTIVMPLDHTDPRTDVVRIRNLTRRAVAEAGAAPGMPDVTSLLDPLERLLTAAHPIPRPYGAVALFAAPGTAHLVPLHAGADESVHIGEEFDVIPLVDEVDPAYCFLMTIARGGAHLWRATRHDLAAVPLEGAPEALAEITWYRDLETQLQLHRSGGGTATFHGQGVDEDAELEPLRTYLRRIDDAVARSVGDAEPLTVIGPGRLPAIYRTVSRHRRYVDLLDAHPDGLSAAALHDLGTATAERMAAARTATLLETAGTLSGSGRSSTDPADVVRAATEGRVDTLLVSAAERDTETRTAVMRTLRHGGDVLPMVGADMLLAAVHRW